MDLRKLAFTALAAALALGTAHAAHAHAADDTAAKDEAGFNELDKDDDGALSRAEAAGKPALAARFKEVDGDGDGKLSRVEYLKVMAKKDFRSLREKAADFIDPDDKPAASRGGSK